MNCKHAQKPQTLSKQPQNPLAPALNHPHRLHCSHHIRNHAPKQSPKLILRSAHWIAQPLISFHSLINTERDRIHRVWAQPPNPMNTCTIHSVNSDNIITTRSITAHHSVSCMRQPPSHPCIRWIGQTVPHCAIRILHTVHIGVLKKRQMRQKMQKIQTIHVRKHTKIKWISRD